MIYIIIILAACLIFSIFAILNLIKQVEKAEEEFEIAFEAESAYFSKLSEIRTRILNAQTRMKEIDIRGSFEADDEVGTAFKELQATIDVLNAEIIKIYESE